MTAYYKVGMTEAQQRALSATLPQAERDALLAAGLVELAKLKCRDANTDKCANLEPSIKIPNVDCQALADGWTGDYDKMEAAYEALPACAKKGFSVGEKVVGATVLAAVVAVIVKLARRRK